MLHAVRDLLVLLAELVVVRQNSLGFIIFAGEHRDMGAQGVAFRLQLLVFPPKGREGFRNRANFCFQLFGFGHGSIIQLEVASFNARLIFDAGFDAEKKDLHGRLDASLAGERLSFRSQVKISLKRTLIPRFSADEEPVCEG
jgi:hypothetical protein